LIDEVRSCLKICRSALVAIVVPTETTLLYQLVDRLSSLRGLELSARP
jgi:hypothetical protein